MNHITEEQLLNAYYGEFDASEHSSVCAECKSRFENLQETLNAIREYPGPEFGRDRIAAAWERLLPQLPPNRRRWWREAWILTPALAALLGVVFFAGRFTRPVPPEPTGISEKSRERILLLSLSDHLEHAQIVLENVSHAEPGAPDLAAERDRAHELLGANRLLRQTAERLGDLPDAALLEQLERVLMDVANSSPKDLGQIQQRMKQEGLLFAVRVTSTTSRERGQRL